ncbi:MAG: cohesin domain-containing protein [Acidobacteriota bacterium]
MPQRSSRATALAILSLGLLLSGCAAQRAYKRGERASVTEDWDKAFTEYVRANAIDPGNSTYKVAVERARLKASQAHFKKGRVEYLRGEIEDAILQFEQAIVLDPTNEYFADELEKAKKEVEKKKSKEDREKGEIEALKEKVRKEDPIIPVLSLSSDVPITLKFTDTDVKEVYNSLGKLAGINILFDEQVREKKMSIDLTDVTFQQALDTLLLINQHYYKIIDEHSIIIIPDNQTKRRQYDELVIKTFYLSSADMNEVQQLIQRLLNTRFMSTSKGLNSITIRDTADKVAIAEKIIEANDKSKSEILIDVELMEINRRSLESLGTKLSDYLIGETLDQGDDKSLGIPLSRIDKLTQNDWFLKFPSITYNFLKQDSDTRLIAKPQIRVSEGEKANILIGDRVPIPTTTFNTNQTQGGNIVPITSFQYQDVGIKINFEPRVHHNKEVTLKLKVEVSQITDTNASGQPTIGTRTIETVIRLKEGETNLLAGLIREDQGTGKRGVPGLSDIPLLGKLFSQNDSDRRKTDLVLTLTPHIIRLPNIREEDLEPLYVGTEENTILKLGPRGARSLFTQPGEEGDEEEENAAPAEPPGESKGEEKSSAPGNDGGTGMDMGHGAGHEGEEKGTGGETSENEPPKEENPPPTQPALVLIQPAAVEVPKDGSFTIDILVMQGTNVGHVPFYLSFDPTVLAFQSAAEGGFLKQGGAQTSFLQSQAQPGILIFGCSRLGTGPGASGSGAVATVTFKALKPGTSTLSFSNNFVKDPTTAPLPADWRGAQVTVK